jgi:hypothetical protein
MWVKQQQVYGPWTIFDTVFGVSHSLGSRTAEASSGYLMVEIIYPTSYQMAYATVRVRFYHGPPPRADAAGIRPCFAL